jgi:probable HAF family extracellular repeat protein
LSSISGATAGDRTSGIDANGDLSGYSQNASGSYLPWFLPSGSSSAMVLPVLSSSDQVCPYAMNSSQQIVGAEGADANPGTAEVAGTCQAVLWTQSGGSWGISTLPAIAAGAYAGAAAISSNGIVAGWSNTVTGTLSGSNLGYQNAVTWTNTGSGRVVNDLVNRSVYTLGAFGAMAVNSAGTAVGWGNFGGINPLGGCNAVEFTGSGTALMLGNLGALGAGNDVVPDDTALGINDSGIVVGTATTSSGVNDAFIYYPSSNRTMQDMNTVFASVIPSGWSLTAATAIDDNGDIIGYGTYHGTTEGFLIAAATVPEPSTLLLLATGLMGLLACA